MAIAEEKADHQISQDSPTPTNLVSTFVEVGSVSNQASEVTVLDRKVAEALEAWLVKSPSLNTRANYALDLNQFLDFVRIPSEHLGRLTAVRPQQVAAWRDHLRDLGLTNSSVRRKMTALRAFFSYLQTYGYCGANPAHSDFVEAPAVPRDGKTVGLSPEDCRRLLDAPDLGTPA